MRLETLCDFVDDAIEAPFTEQHVDSLMRELKSIGVSRISWAYYGDGHGGYNFPAGIDEGRADARSWENYAQTLRDLGNPLRVAVRSAHRHGLECYAYFKPYETGPGMVAPSGSPDADQFGFLDRVGERLLWLDPFVVDRPRLRIAHKQAGASDSGNSIRTGGPVCALQLRKRDDSPTRIAKDHLRIWTSRDNYRYEPLNIDFSCTDRVESAASDIRDARGTVLTERGRPIRTITLSGFRIDEPFVLVGTDFTDGAGQGPPDFENAGTAMLRAYDAAGNELSGIYGTERGLWLRDKINYRTWGVMFDTGFGASPVYLDAPGEGGKRGFVAFSPALNAYLPGALCETEPDVQEYWLKCVGEILDAGVDGIDLRIENHSTHSDTPDDYGYNDVVTQSGDDVAEVRGRAYTEFLRRVRTVTQQRNVKMRINLNIDYFRPDPPAGRLLAYPRNVNFNWRTWVDDALMDEAILRMFELPLDKVYTDAAAQEMVDRCQARGIPMTVNRYIGHTGQGEVERIRADGRFDAWVLYETATFLTAQPGGGVAWKDEAARKIAGSVVDG